MAKILYLTYDGLLDPLGYSQVFKLMERLSEKHSITILSFEKPEKLADVREQESMRSFLKVKGIEWRALKYHRSPSVPATAYDVAMGFFYGFYVCIRNKIEIVHARSYVVSLIAVALKNLLGVKFLFDMRGFWADERVESGIWKKGGRLYRCAKYCEKVFFKKSDAVVSLSRMGAREIISWKSQEQSLTPIYVITTCTDLQKFKPHQKTSVLPLIFGHVGAVGLWYDFDAAVRCFLLAKKIFASREPHLLILNRDEHELIRKKLRFYNVPEPSVSLLDVRPSDMPEKLSEVDVALFFIRPTYAKKASAPTKLGELLGSGIPCITNQGVGDVDEILAEGVGVTVPNVTAAVLERGLGELSLLLKDSGLSERCRGVAEKWLSLAEGVNAYDRLYKEILGNPVRRNGLNRLVIQSAESPG